MVRTSFKGRLFEKRRPFNTASIQKETERVLRRYADLGTNALRESTPKDTGNTGSKWESRVTVTAGGARIAWSNTNENDGVQIALILQYGHGTGTGGYVEGTDYINPALKPVFEQIKDALLREVTDIAKFH